MLKNTIFTLLAILLFSCKSFAQKTDTDIKWANAKWIGLEKIEDSLIVVPGIHGFKKSLKNKYTKRS
ncbi:hypothetical protein MNBD_IGNAVI01-3243, partial [hydrothermal vent metagenome]